MRRLFLLPGRVTAALLHTVWRFCAAFFRSGWLAPRLVLKPRLLLLWLVRSHYAQVLMLMVLLGLTGIIPETLDRLIEFVYQTTPQSTPKVAEIEARVRGFLPYGAGVMVMLAFWFSIPAALRRAADIAAMSELKADALAEVVPSSSAQLYRRAIALTTNSAQLKTLRSKLKGADSDGWDGAPGGQTVVMQATERPSDTGQRYETLRELGRGTMGVVLLAHDNVLEREVAIKELPLSVANDPDLLARFRREAKAQARLNHPGIVQVYDFAEFHGNAWIVMEYVEGEELEAVAKKKGKLEPSEVHRIAVKMAEALEFTHERGVLHRDLKPANVIVDRQGQPKIMDFGVARLAMSAGKTIPGTVLGSPAFMSPEQARGKDVDVQADVYALGAIMYTLLAGRRIFEGSVEEVIAQVLHQKPEPVRKIEKKTPLKLARLVMSMVAKNPKERPTSMSKVLSALGEIRIRT